MTAPPASKAFIDAALDAVAREIATLRQEAARERDLRDAQFAAKLAELETRLAGVADMERRVAERLASLRDGQDGSSVTLDDVAPMIAAEIARRMAELPIPKDGENGAPGRDADPEEIRAMVDAAVADAMAALPPPEKGDPGPMGALPTVEEWTDKVYYQGAVVSCSGALHQAVRDTGKPPGHEDWRCIVRAGTDGAAGRSFVVRGTWDESVDYAEMDVVARDGASFVARCDNPGPCPGEGWQLMAMRGKTGKPGEPGPRGEPGRSVSGVVSAIALDEANAILTVTNSDGSVVRCDLYPMLARIAGGR